MLPRPSTATPVRSQKEPEVEPQLMFSGCSKVYPLAAGHSCTSPTPEAHSVINAFPLPSSARKMGELKPDVSVLTVEYPPAAGISINATVFEMHRLLLQPVVLAPELEPRPYWMTNTLSLASTATSSGPMKPLPSVLTQLDDVQPGGTSLTALLA